MPGNVSVLRNTLGKWLPGMEMWEFCGHQHKLLTHHEVLLLSWGRKYLDGNAFL